MKHAVNTNTTARPGIEVPVALWEAQVALEEARHNHGYNSGEVVAARWHLSETARLCRAAELGRTRPLVGQL